MKNVRCRYLIKIGVILLHMSIESLPVEAQHGLKWKELPPLPDTVGRAGMFAGVSGGRLFCMGGANFPDKYPWEGGKKVWHDDMFMLDEGGEWHLLDAKLPRQLAYGVSVSYDNHIVIVGGSGKDRHYADCVAFRWEEGRLIKEQYPALPVSLANMAGTLVGDVIVVVGGSESSAGNPSNQCYLLDLQNLSEGWVQLAELPGPARVFPVVGAKGMSLFVFSGEGVFHDIYGVARRQIFSDAYRLDLSRSNGTWEGEWRTLAPMPKAAAAGPAPAPLLANCFLLWGGIDGVSALHNDPETYPELPNDILRYYPDSDMWEFQQGNPQWPGRVTLPTVFYHGYSYYVNGEVKPGVRTNRIVGVASSNAGNN